MLAQSRPVPVAVNYHLWPKCNLNCTFCFATFPNARATVPTAQSREILRLLAAAGTEKITFVGGEPTLHPDLAELLRLASDLGMTTCVVTNGAKLLQVLDAAPDAVDWVGLSVDSASETVQARLGRGRGDHVGASLALAQEVRRRGIRLKLNTVVTVLNWEEDLSALVSQIAPDRWKAFQVLSVEGENHQRVAPLLISSAQYASFVDRHASIATEHGRHVELVAEFNDDMRGSYVMINPEGCFFSNETGRYLTSAPILRVGVDAALAQVGWRQDKFHARGGLYDWTRDRPGRRPFVVAIEGLDGSGKSTAVRSVADKLGGQVVSNPPAELAGERAAAEALDPVERRSWFLRANRAAMRQARAAQGDLVVMDRSVASTLAFGAAEQGREAARTDIPANFPMPDLIIFLAVPEAARLSRHAGRGDTATAEERRLAHDHRFRSRVLAGYAALCDLEVDAQGAAQDVANAITATISRERSGLRG